METKLELLQFKNDVLKDIRNLEKKINEQIKSKYDLYDSALSELIKKIEKLELENSASSTSLIEIKSKLNVFNDFYTFRQNIDNRIYNHEMRIKISLDEINRIKAKYDKIIDDNLRIPSIIGSTSKYKNLRDYLNYVNAELPKIKNETEEQKKIITDVKKNFDILPKTMVNMVDSSTRQCYGYTEEIQKDIKKNIDVKLNEFNEKIMEIKVENLDNKKLFEEKTNILNEEINQYKSIRNEILASVEEKIKKLKEKEKDKDQKLKKLIKDVEEFKNKKKKQDEQILNNIKSINDIKTVIKKLSAISERTPRSDISNSNNTIDNIIKNPIVQPIIEKKNTNILDTITRNNEIQEKKFYSEEKTMRSNEHDNSKSKENIENKLRESLEIKKVENSQNKPEVKFNIKNKVSQFNSFVPKTQPMKNNPINIISKTENNVRQFSLLNHENLSSSSSSPSREKKNKNQKVTNTRRLSKLTMKYNQEISNLIFNSKKIMKNKDKTIITEEDNYNKNILLRTEEFKNGINKLKEEFELSGYKPNINRAKNLLNLNSNSRTINLNSNSKTLNLNKPINFQNTKLIANINNVNNINTISNDFKTNTLYKYRNFINNDIKTNTYYGNFNSIKNLSNSESYNDNSKNKIGINNDDKKLFKNEINNDDIKLNKNDKNSEIIKTDEINTNSKLRKVINLNKNHKSNNNFTKINNNKINISNKINQNLNLNAKKDEIKITSNIQKFQNINVISQKNINKESIDSLNNSQNKISKNNINSINNINNNKPNLNGLIDNYLSRNDNGKNIKNPNTESLKINNIDLFTKEKKNINEKNYEQNYSFNGKKIKQKPKEKTEENSPVDTLYKAYFNKRNKNVIVSREKNLNDPKKLTPVFGRTSYEFYDKKNNNKI